MAEYIFSRLAQDVVTAGTIDDIANPEFSRTPLMISIPSVTRRPIYLVVLSIMTPRCSVKIFLMSCAYAWLCHPST